MIDRDALYNETNETANKEAMADIYLPSLVWNRSYLIPKRPDFDATLKLAEAAHARRLTVEEIKTEIDKAILLFLKSEAGRDFKVGPSVGSDIILFSGAFDDTLVKKGVDPTSALVGTQTVEHTRILNGGERAVVLSGRYHDRGKPYSINIRVHVHTDLFTVVVIATPDDADVVCLKEGADFLSFTTTFWQRFSAYVLRSCNVKRNFGHLGLTSVFAESRGVIASSSGFGGPDCNAAFKLGDNWAEPIIKHLHRSLRRSAKLAARQLTCWINGRSA